MKYRVLEVKNNGLSRFAVQEKWLFFSWSYVDTASTLEEAKIMVNNLRKHGTINNVVYEG